MTFFLLNRYSSSFSLELAFSISILSFSFSLYLFLFFLSNFLSLSLERRAWFFPPSIRLPSLFSLKSSTTYPLVADHSNLSIHVAWDVSETLWYTPIWALLHGPRCIPDVGWVYCLKACICQEPMSWVRFARQICQFYFRIADIPEMNLGSQMETNDRSVGNLVVPFFSVVTKTCLKKYSWVKLLFSTRKIFCGQEESHEIAMQHFSFSSLSNNM